MNYYAGDVSVTGIQQWLGNVYDGCLPSTVDIDWIKVESLQEYKNRMHK